MRYLSDKIPYESLDDILLLKLALQNLSAAKD